MKIDCVAPHWAASITPLEFPCMEGEMPHAGCLSPAPTPISPLALIELQDHLLAAGHDLSRLATLLDDACRQLLLHFDAATVQVRALSTDDLAGRERACAEIGKAVTGLQFQDLSSQLVTHACDRLRYCADRLATAAFGSDDDAEDVVAAAPPRPNPVTQSEMDAGSVELF